MGLLTNTIIESDLKNLIVIVVAFLVLVMLCGGIAGSILLWRFLAVFDQMQYSQEKARSQGQSFLQDTDEKREKAFLTVIQKYHEHSERMIQSVNETIKEMSAVIRECSHQLGANTVALGRVEERLASDSGIHQFKNTEGESHEH